MVPIKNIALKNPTSSLRQDNKEQRWMGNLVLFLKFNKHGKEIEQNSKKTTQRARLSYLIIQWFYLKIIFYSYILYKNKKIKYIRFALACIEKKKAHIHILEVWMDIKTHVVKSIMLTMLSLTIQNFYFDYIPCKLFFFFINVIFDNRKFHE